MSEPRCHWCGQQYAIGEFYPAFGEFYPACCEDHLKRLRGAVGNTPYFPPAAKEVQIKLWAKFVNHQYASWSALFELITGFKPPKMKDIADLISGKN